MCVYVAFFALTLWYILLSFPFYSIRCLYIHVIVHRSTRTVVDLQAKPLEREVLNYIQTTCSYAKCFILVHLALKKR